MFSLKTSSLETIDKTISIELNFGRLLEKRKAAADHEARFLNERNIWNDAHFTTVKSFKIEQPDDNKVELTKNGLC